VISCFISMSQMPLVYQITVNVRHAEDKLKRNLGWKLRLLVMCGIRTWFDFWVFALKALTGSKLFIVCVMYGFDYNFTSIKAYNVVNVCIIIVFILKIYQMLQKSSIYIFLALVNNMDLYHNCISFLIY